MRYQLADLERRFASLINIGRVLEIDVEEAAVRVEIGEIQTDWLSLMAVRAGSGVTWDPPSVGEQVVVFSPAGDLAQGIVFPALYQDKFPAPADRTADNTIRTFPDGSVISYDSKNKTFTADLKGNATLNVATDAQMIVGGGVTINVTGDAKINAPTVSLNEGDGVVTGACICAFTGAPHSDFSSTVKAGK